ncbi:MAG: NUDIX domain-containing protein [Sandaracinaceae bacterium]
MSSRAGGHRGELPLPSAVDVRVLAERRDAEGFLRMRRLTLQNRYDDGVTSAPYPYDLVERAALDAVAIVLFTRDEDGVRVVLRSALRPPLAFRDPPESPVQWEIPAGLIEPDELPDRTASREAEEEVGLVVPPARFAPLGPPVYLSPGVMAERLHFVVAEIAEDELGAPTEDGTPVEERAVVRVVPLDAALELCRRGAIRDIKTETGLRRLEEHA